MRSLRFHKNWLAVSAVIIAFFGPALTLGTMEPYSEPARLGLQILSGPGYETRSFAEPTTRFLSALTGGFLMGWGMTLIGLRQWAFDLAPEAVRRTVLLGTLSWFCFDSTGSILSGTPWNAFFNVVVMICVIGPMWLPARTDA